MKQSIRCVIVLVMMFLLPGVDQSNAQPPVSPKKIAELPKQFGVSPDLLAKFRNHGMGFGEIQNGLSIAKKVAAKGDLSITEAADKVMSARQGGKGWGKIAKDFDVEPLGQVISDEKKVPAKALDKAKTGPGKKGKGPSKPSPGKKVLR